jgi:hypothetical protein
METIYKNKVGAFTAEIFYDREKRVIFYFFSGLFDTTVLIECNKVGMKFIESNPCVAVFTDTLEARGSFSSLNKFFKEEVAPHTEKHGVQIIAFATAGDIFTRFATNTVLKIIQSKMIIRVFGDRLSAKEWLEQNMRASLTLPAR